MGHIFAAEHRSCARDGHEALNASRRAENHSSSPLMSDADLERSALTCEPIGSARSTPGADPSGVRSIVPVVSASGSASAHVSVVAYARCHRWSARSKRATTSGGSSPGCRLRSFALRRNSCRILSGTSCGCRGGLHSRYRSAGLPQRAYGPSSDSQESPAGCPSSHAGKSPAATSAPGQADFLGARV